MRIGFLGPRGTFTEEALDLWLRKQELKPTGYEKVAYPSISDVMNTVGKETSIGIVPVENSLEGSVNITIDSFIHDVDVKIRGEVILPIVHNLFAVQDIPLEEVVEVHSHPQALYQCHNFISKNMPGVRMKETLSTASAAKLVSGSKCKYAAIGSKSLTQYYDLSLLASGIQDKENNRTRFFVLSIEDSERTDNDKTALIFSAKNKPGSLFECLKVFAKNDINLTKIESRPAKRNLGEYIFFIVVEGHRKDKYLETALLQLKSHVGFYRILGSYPVFPS